MKKIVKNLVLAGADILGVNAIFRAINKDRVRVLMYHGVTKSKFAPPYWTQLESEVFRWQMDYVKDHFIVGPASQLESGNALANAVIITFDDGLQNVYDNALPILEELGLRAICFVLPELSRAGKSIWPDRVYETFLNPRVETVDLTGFVLPRHEIKNQTAIVRARLAGELIALLKSRPHGFRNRVLEFLETEHSNAEPLRNSEFRLMTLEQIKAVSESGVIEIGLHTDTHPILSTQTRDEQLAEIAGCRKSLNNAGIRYLDVFAYPNGRYEDFNDDSISILKEIGIRMAFTTEDGFHAIGDDIYRIKRIPIGSDLSRREFAARLSGFYYFIKAFLTR